MQKWLSFLEKTIEQVGSVKGRDKNLSIEKRQLRNFQRGVYKNKISDIKRGTTLKEKSITFNFPAVKGQLTANNFSKFSEIVMKKNPDDSERIMVKNLSIKNPRNKISIIRNKIRTLASLANIIVPNLSRIEISHHYGINNFFKYGLSMITVINQSYCKKYLFMLKNQKHPAQYHKIKQETFLILFGRIMLKIKFKGKIQKKIMNSGETFTIVKGMIHEFKALSKDGAVIEEISSKHIKSDSYYLDKRIRNNKNRKSLISYY